MSFRKCWYIFATRVALASVMLLELASTGCSIANYNIPDHEVTPEYLEYGSQLFTVSCRRCHNARPTNIYSEAEWDVVMHHMRVRANLTADEQQAMVSYLKSAN